MRLRPSGLLALAVPALALLADPAPTVGQEGTPPSVYDVDVAAAPFASEGQATAAVPLLVESGLARSSVKLNSQPAIIAQAALTWAPLAEAAPALLGTPPPPVAPWCYAYDPGDPAEAECGGPAQDLAGWRARAASGHAVARGEAAGPGGLGSEASATALGVEGPAEAPGSTIRSVASAARAAIQGGRLVAGASTRIEDVTIAGVLAIDVVQSAVSAALRGEPGTASVERAFRIVGARVGEQAVVIDGEGVHVAGERLGGEIAALQEQVNEQLTAAGLSVRTVPAGEPEVAQDGTKVAASTGGLLVTFRPADGIASTVLIGRSSVRMQGFQDAASLLAGAAEPAEPPPATAGATPVGRAGDIARPPVSPSTPQPPPAAPEPGGSAPAPSERPFLTSGASAPYTWKGPVQAFAALAFALPLLVAARRFTFSKLGG